MEDALSEFDKLGLRLDCFRREAMQCVCVCVCEAARPGCNRRASKMAIIRSLVAKWGRRAILDCCERVKSTQRAVCGFSKCGHSATEGAQQGNSTEFADSRVESRMLSFQPREVGQYQAVPPAPPPGQVYLQGRRQQGARLAFKVGS